MQSLLRWGIENSTATTSGSDVAPSPPARRTDLDPGIIDAILGRPDSELMKEALAKAQDTSLDEDARLTALDDLEMLVENIDNANDLEKLGMWEPLQDLLGSPSEDMKVQALWVIGTALQNNPAAQKAYLALEPLPTILSYLDPSAHTPKRLRAKAIYTLSGLLKHNVAAIDQFEAAGGWDTLRDALSDSDIAVRRKAAFLLNSLLIQSAPVATSPASGTRIRDGPAQPAATVHPNSHASMVADPTSADTAPETLRAVRAHGLLHVIVRELTEPTPYGPDGDEGDGDADLEERLMRVLYTYVSVHNGTFDKQEKSTLRTFLDASRAAPGESELGLEAEELREIMNAVA